MKSSESYVFTEDELVSINEMRTEYEKMTDREKFLVKEALKVYLYQKQK